MNLYDTREKQVAFLKRGNIVTFKTSINMDGFMAGGRSQFAIDDLEEQYKGDKVRLLGRFFDSFWFDNMDVLLNTINWEQMEEWHSNNDN